MNFNVFDGKFRDASVASPRVTDVGESQVDASDRRDNECVLKVYLVRVGNWFILFISMSRLVTELRSADWQVNFTNALIAVRIDIIDIYSTRYVQFSK